MVYNFFYSNNNNSSKKKMIIRVLKKYEYFGIFFKKNIFFKNQKFLIYFQCQKNSAYFQYYDLSFFQILQNIKFQL